MTVTPLDPDARTWVTVSSRSPVTLSSALVPSVSASLHSNLKTIASVESNLAFILKIKILNIISLTLLSFFLPLFYWEHLLI